MNSLHARRVENEWRILQQAAAANAGALEIGSRHSGVAAETFVVTLRGTPALVRSYNGLGTLSLHRIELRLEEFFPAIPMQAFLSVPVVHPNVNPFNGFVCLWDRFASGDSVLAVLRQLQRVITWELFNPSPLHVMQPNAFELYEKREPLPYTLIEIPFNSDASVKHDCSHVRRHRSRLNVPDG